MRPAPRSEDELVAALHEVGNALTVILGWLGEAQRNISDDASSLATKAALELCEKRSRRAVALCRRTIGAEPLVEAAEPLPAIVREVALALGPTLKASGVHLEELITPAAGAVWVPHVSDLVSVLTNLLFNAAEALAATEGSERSVEIACDAAGDRILLILSDTGCGVDDAVRGRLFSRGATTKATGAGVGLSHSRSLAEGRGGSLRLIESKPGRTSFEVTWPVMGALRSPSITLEETPHTLRKRDLRGLSIAVVDDDPGVIELLEMVLSARGARVRAFPRYEPFAAALAAQTSVTDDAFQILLLDASPLGDALEATLQGLRTHHRDLGLVLISGASDPGATLGKLGVTWIRKPFDIEEVVFVIQTLKRAEAR